MLTTLGVAWIATGVSIALNSDPAYVELVVPLTWLSPETRGAGWIITGMVSCAYAWRPRWIAYDVLGFLALYVMPAYRAGAFLWGWLDSWLPLGGGPGYRPGLVQAALAAAMMGVVMICSDWPDPVPKALHLDPDPDRHPDAHQDTVP